MTNNSSKLVPTEIAVPAMVAQICAGDTSQVQCALQALSSELSNRPDADSIAIIWQTDDVQMQRPDLGIDQCREVLGHLDRYHDATIGINWDVIDYVAHDCYPEPDNLAELRELAEAD